MPDQSPEKNPSEPSPDDEGLGLPTYDDVMDEVVRAPSPGDPPPERKVPEIYRIVPPPEKDEALLPKKRVIPALQAALGGRAVEEILPRLTSEHRDFLEQRYDLSTGRRLKSHAELAQIMGININQVSRLEAEVLSEVTELAAPAEEEPR